MDIKFWAKLFDKMDSFSLAVVLMLYLDSNIPSKAFYLAFGADILRSGRRSMMLPSFDQSNDKKRK